MLAVSSDEWRCRQREELRRLQRIKNVWGRKAKAAVKDALFCFPVPLSLASRPPSSCAFPNGCKMAAVSPDLTSALRADRQMDGGQGQRQKAFQKLHPETAAYSYWSELGGMATARSRIRELRMRVRSANQQHLPLTLLRSPTSREPGCAAYVWHL